MTGSLQIIKLCFIWTYLEEERKADNENNYNNNKLKTEKIRERIPLKYMWIK